MTPTPGTGPLVIAVDVGTGSAKAVAIAASGSVVAQTRHSYRTSVPRPGWAEQDPRDWVNGALSALAQLVAQLVHPSEVRAISLTGQTPTFAAVDASAAPLGPGLLYRDNRALAEAAELRELLGAKAMHRRTGQVPEPFHIAPKLQWLRRHDEKLFNDAAYFLQPRDLVLHRLTGEFATDETHANSTLLYDLTARQWAPDLFEAMRLDPRTFPPVLSSGAVVGALSPVVADQLGLPRACSVVVGGADSQCAALGTGVTDPGSVSEMAGTSSCVNSAIVAPVGEIGVSQYAHVVPGRFTTELGINTTGGAVRWGLTTLGFADFGELAAAAATVHERFRSSQTADVCAAAPIFLPFLADGDRSDPRLRAGFLGVSDRHGRAELAYAVLEGVAFSVGRTLETLRDAGLPTDDLRVSGGAATLGELGRIKADALGITVRHFEADAATTGAAVLGAVATGVSQDYRAAADACLASSTAFDPDPLGSSALRERYEWFRSVLSAPSIRTPSHTSRGER